MNIHARKTANIQYVLNIFTLIYAIGFLVASFYSNVC